MQDGVIKDDVGWSCAKAMQDAIARRCGMEAQPWQRCAETKRGDAGWRRNSGKDVRRQNAAMHVRHCPMARCADQPSSTHTDHDERLLYSREMRVPRKMHACRAACHVSPSLPSP
eukprot:351327-Chlamydomonas_euryale.AAC.3